MTTLAELHTRSVVAFERQRFCTIAEAAKYLGRHTQYVYRLVAEQKLKSVYDGGRRMVVVKDLIRYGDSLSIDREDDL